MSEGKDVYIWENKRQWRCVPIELPEAQRILLNGEVVYAHSSSGWGMNPIRWNQNGNTLQVANICGEWSDFSSNSLTSMILSTPQMYKKDGAV